WARFLLPVAKDLGVKIATDLQDITDIADPYRQDFIEYSDILFFSNTNYDSPEPIINHILKQFPEKILVSGMGSQGCALGTQKGIDYFSAMKIKGPIIDTNGAGDSLAVGFLSSHLLEEKNLRESIQLGQLTARYTCTQKASTSKLISRNKLEKLKNQI
ncbi:MAG TPA: PfkB family carbohydrate kinase, partial [bacterium]|nr:PfkB family carbohydrate kinase [bacterium]